MHGILYVDKYGQEVSPYYTWQNPRGYKKTGDESLEYSLSEMLGYPVYTGYGIVTHYSLYKEKNIPASARVVCNIGDYVCMNLSGASVPFTDITLGNSMGICNIKSGQKSKSLDLLGSECSGYFPEIVPTTKLLGEYRGIPVIQALGDNQASFLGSVRDKERSVLLNYGTAGQISFYSKRYENYSGFETRPLCNEGFIHAAFSLCGGNSYKILAHFFKETTSLFSLGTISDTIKIMDEMVLDFSNETIDCMPLFFGQRGRKSDSGYFKNITEENFTPGNMVKAIVQGMVKELHQHYEELPNSVKNRILYLIGSGNGIRKNRHLQNAVKLTYGKNVSLLNHSEESCIGAIINAGKGTGIYADYSEGAAEIIDCSE
jgi:sedoheptulokinase